MSTDPLTPDQRAFVEWARQHLKDWRDRDAAMLSACRAHQERRECGECIAQWVCVRYGNQGQPCEELSGPRPLQMPNGWPVVVRNFGGVKRPGK